MNDRKFGPKGRRGGGKPFKKPGKSAGRPTWRDRDSDPDGPVVLYGWHTVTMALANPARQIRKLTLTENAAKRLAEENIETRIAPEIVRPEEIDRLLSPDAVHQGLLAEADPLPSPDIESLEQDGMVLVLDQITDPHNVGAILRSAAAFAVKAIVTTGRHSPEATGVLAKAASGALELVPIITVPNLARALTTLNDIGFQTVGLDSEGSEDLGRCRATRAARAGSGRGRQGAAASDARDLQRRGAARHARRDQEPQRLECRRALALCRREPARTDEAVERFRAKRRRAHSDDAIVRLFCPTGQAYFCFSEISDSNNEPMRDDHSSRSHCASSP